jgi:hypothetical protein
MAKGPKRGASPARQYGCGCISQYVGGVKHWVKCNKDQCMMAGQHKEEGN